MNSELLSSIISYIPYGLKCEILNYKCDYVGIQHSTVTGYYMVGDIPHFTYLGGGTGKSMNEIIFIMKDINSIDLNDDCWIHNKHLFDQSDILGDIEFVHYNLVRLLIANMYDIFNLNQTGLVKYETI